jgi:hypothetical protein
LNTTDLEVCTAVQKSLNALRDEGPEPLVEEVAHRLRRSPTEASEEDIVALTTGSDLADPTRRAMHMALATWDASGDASWAEGSAAWSAERRECVYDLLELSEAGRQKLNAAFPSASQMDTMIVDPEKWEPWYDETRRVSRDFYWRAYRGVLEAKGWDIPAIATLDRSTNDIVSRLADPSAAVGYQTKGLVVGHVQSGKTANFTGIVAKAVDAGYRLIIVLTGTIELLRSQTQRRLDMELVGEENILDGVDRYDTNSVREIDYISSGDDDWLGGKFLSHNIDIHSSPEIPSIKRLTTAGKDYRKLRLGRDALDFRRTGELRNSTKPVYDPENIHAVDARLAVMKKNTTSLNNLLHDLKNIRADGREIPVLIIDDEADQASVNTVNPRSHARTAAESRQRSTINKLIAEMLEVMPRAQYIGYTATPFANVFISPDDSKDLFPKDFLVSLEPSADYMGGREFHDLWAESSEYDKKDPARSNEAAFIRDLRADGDEDPQAEELEILAALDSFVISGAIKKWREASSNELSYRHHTMLVHESALTAEHSQLADTLRRVWTQGQYSSPASTERLEKMFEGDFLRVHNARKEWGNLSMPSSYRDLMPFVGATVNSIMSDGDPVVIVNGTSDSDYSQLDFQTRPYWRIMIGGAKLSRGFTVEGLTVTYYRRRTAAADTLMQMGRWFGYRPGYRDLVRLYIGRQVVDGQKKAYDLYSAFTSIIEDEEEFRTQLRRFAVLTEDGRPLVRPIHVPPLVFQQLPWLRPTGRNKMYNAELQFEGEGGQVKDFNAHADRGEGTLNRKHFVAVQHWLERLSAPVEFLGGDGLKFNAQYTVATTADLLDTLSCFEFASRDQLAPTLNMIERARAEGKVEDWAIVVPTLESKYVRGVEGTRVSVMGRQRRLDRPGFPGSERRHRPALQVISEHPDAARSAGPEADRLAASGRGALLLTFTADPEVLPVERDEAGRGRPSRDRILWSALPPELPSTDVATLFSIALPYKAAPRGRIGFGVRREDLPNEAIVDSA